MARIVDVFRFLRNGSNLADILNDLDITPGRLQTIIHSQRFKKLIALQEEIAQIGIRLTATTCAMRAAGLLELIAMNQYHKGNRQACVDLLRNLKATEHLAPEIEKDVDRLISESVDSGQSEAKDASPDVCPSEDKVNWLTGELVNSWQPEPKVSSPEFGPSVDIDRSECDTVSDRSNPHSEIRDQQLVNSQFACRNSQSNSKDRDREEEKDKEEETKEANTGETPSPLTAPAGREGHSELDIPPDGGDPQSTCFRKRQQRGSMAPFALAY